jgi:hypothetical protein
MVIYPISHPDAEGRALINWIAEVTVDSSGGWTGERWFEPAKVTDFVHHFDAFRYPWLDVPAFLSGERRGLDEPDDRPRPGAHMGWRARGADGRRGACDVSHRVERREPGDHRRRTIGAMMLAHGVGPEALSAYDAALCGPVSELVLRNRNAGPFGLLDIVDARCGGVFDDIDDVIPPAERAAFIADYKAAAGFAIDRLNAAPPTIPPGARVVHA